LKPRIPDTKLELMDEQHRHEKGLAGMPAGKRSPNGRIPDDTRLGQPDRRPGPVDDEFQQLDHQPGQEPSAPYAAHGITTEKIDPDLFVLVTSILPPRSATMASGFTGGC
jgi:hypothetical protein